MKPGHNFREKLFTIIFEADTPAGKLFDIVLLVLIVLSVAVVMLESLPEMPDSFRRSMVMLERIFTALFTIEYGLRLYAVSSRWKYIRSPLGIIDLISIAPTYLSFFMAGSERLMIFRILRLLRIFRIFKLTRFMNQARFITDALRSSRDKIYIFLFAVSLITVVTGAIMYLIEGGLNPGFDSIPRSIYWCVVTITTVGYGDISPITALGQFLASLLMITGYSIIAVPTGIISSEMARRQYIPETVSTQVCPHCTQEGHDRDAVHCKYCGARLNEEKNPA
jgi:voltage-gated potassium channel